MRVITLTPGVGLQCFLNAADGRRTAYVVQAVSQPPHIRQGRSLTLAPQLGGRPLKLSLPQFAAHVIDGKLELGGGAAPASEVGAGSGAKANGGESGQLVLLIELMSARQRVTYAMRLAYVQAVDLANTGLSHKSRGFRDLCDQIYASRRADFEARRGALQPGETMPEIEQHPPSPYSVYRWYLRYRNAGHNPAVLAQEVAALRTRVRRKPAAMRFAEAFVKMQSARVEATSVTAMHRELKRRFKRLNPLAVDDAIQRLAEETERIAKRNAATRKGRGMKKGKRRRGTP